MRKIIFHLSTRFAGMDSTENALYPDDVSDEELDFDAWQLAVQHAETYGVYPESELEEMEEDEINELTQSGEIDNYSSNIDGSWEDCSPEKHDGLKAGGGDWDWTRGSLV